MKRNFEILTPEEAEIVSRPFDLNGFIKELGARAAHNKAIVESGTRFGELVTNSPDFDGEFTQADVAGISTLEKEVLRAKELAELYDKALEALKGI